jgi:hypothetical protein
MSPYDVVKVLVAVDGLEDSLDCALSLCAALGGSPHSPWRAGFRRRGIWGYHGDHAPHGDSFRQLRRRVPVLTVIVDTPDRSRRWLSIVDELTDETGLVTSEMVPAFRATAPEFARGGLKLARLGDADRRA